MRGWNIKNNIKKVIVGLIDQNEALIYDYCQQDRITPECLFQEINEYPGKITLPEDNAFLDYEELQIDANNIIVCFSLWFDEKKSDLIIEIKLIKDENNNIHIRIQQLRVM